MSRARQKPVRAQAVSCRRSSVAKLLLLSKLIGKGASSNQAARRLLHKRGFRDVGHVLAAIGRLQANALERRNLQKIFHHLIRACEKSADPDRALVSFERLVAALPSRNIFYRYLHESPGQIDLL